MASESVFSVLKSPSIAFQSSKSLNLSPDCQMQIKLLNGHLSSSWAAQSKTYSLSLCCSVRVFDQLIDQDIELLII